MAYSFRRKALSSSPANAHWSGGTNRAVTKISARRWSLTSHLPKPPHFFENEAVRIDVSANPCHPPPGGGATRNPGSRRRPDAGGAVFGVAAVEHDEEAKAERRAIAAAAIGTDLFRLTHSRMCDMALLSTAMIGHSRGRVVKELLIFRGLHIP